MTMRCDHCRGAFQHGVHRYWQMRFCSPECIAAYQQRLDERTKAKIRRLDFPALQTLQNPGWRHRLGSITRHWPG